MLDFISLGMNITCQKEWFDCVDFNGGGNMTT